MDNPTVRRMYDRFSSMPGFWELDAWTCRATASSPYRARVIERLGLGASSRVLDVCSQIALLLETSVHTARAHLRSIFSKTDVSRQTELVLLVLRSAANLG